MHLLRTPSGARHHVRIGIVGTIVLVLVLQLTVGFGFIYRLLLTGEVLTAEFSDVGNLVFGDEVRLAGFTVGSVQSITLEDDRVVVGFSVRDGTLGDMTRAAIKGASPLGKKYLALLPAGAGELSTGDRIPLERTTPPYDVSQALAGLTATTARLDGPRLADAMRATADTLQDTPDELGSTLNGLAGLSATLASRDEELRGLLSHAAGATGVLAARNQQLGQLFADGNQLLAELVARRDAIRSVLVDTTRLLDEVTAMVRENESTMGPALAQLQGVTALLIDNEKNLSAMITGLDTYAGGVGEAAGGGPWLYAFVPNLVPQNLLPPLGEILRPAPAAGLVSPVPGVPR